MQVRQRDTLREKGTEKEVLECMAAPSLRRVIFFATPWTEEPARLLSPWDPPGKNPGAGCHALLQGISPTQGSNPRLLHLLQRRWVLYRKAPEKDTEE